MVEELQCMGTGFAHGGRPEMQSGLKQWMTAAFKLQCEHKGNAESLV